jgi:hypothetical protein
MLPFEQAAARERIETGRPPQGKFPEGETGRVRDKIGAFAGLSGRTVEKIAKVCEARSRKRRLRVRGGPIRESFFPDRTAALCFGVPGVRCKMPVEAARYSLTVINWQAATRKRQELSPLFRRQVYRVRPVNPSSAAGCRSHEPYLAVSRLDRFQVIVRMVGLTRPF